jgi:hypothetical protein
MTQNGNEPPSPSSRPKPPNRSEGFVSEVMSKVSAGASTDPAKKTLKPPKPKKSNPALQTFEQFVGKQQATIKTAMGV